MARLREHPDFLAFIGYLLLATLFYLPILLGSRTFPDGDFTYHFLPFSLFQRSEILAGRLPVWNPYTYAGHPFLADVQAAVYYPLSNLVLALTLPWSSPAARLYWLQVEAVLHVVLAGFFTYLLVRELTGQWRAAFAAGCAFAFSGYLTGYPPLQLAVLRTAIWLPLLLWMLVRAFARPERWRWWTGASLAYAAAFLAGHPQTFLHLSYTVGAWIIFLLASVYLRPEGRPKLATYLWRVGAFYLLFLAVSAAQMLPSLEFTRLSVRADAGYAFLSGGFPVQDTWQMLLPRVLTFFSPLYVGIVGLGLALLALWAAASRGTHGWPALVRASVGFFALLAIVALLVSYGDHGFLYVLFYRWAPGWNLFRGQERAAYLVAFGLSVLAGYGAAALGVLSREQRRLFAGVYGVLVSVGMAVFAVFWQARGRSAVTQAQFVQILVVSLAFLLGFVVVLWSERWSRWRPGLLVALLVGNLFAANFGTNITELSPVRKVALAPEVLAIKTAVEARSQPEPATALRHALTGSQGDSSGQALAPSRNPGANLELPGRVYNEYRAFDDYGMRIGVEDVWGSSPLRLARYAALFDEFPLDRMWRLTGVEHVLTWRRELFGPSELLSQFPQTTDTTYLHRLPETYPRAWITHSIRIADDTEALRLLSDHGFDLASTAVVPPIWDRNRGTGFLEDGLLASSGRNELSLERVASNSLRVHVQSERGGLLVVSENWMPGWRAIQRDDGSGRSRSLPVVRADLSFVGVPVQPGVSTVDLVYFPDSARYGFLISAVTLAFLGFVVIWRRWSPGRRVMFRDVRQLIGPISAAWRQVVVRLGLLGVLLVAFAARVYRLDYQELRGDEALGYFFSLESPREIVRTTIALLEPHPVASYFIQNVWLKWAGHGEFALRFVSVWFGVLGVALLYRLGRRLGLGVFASILAAGLLALSPYAVWHSQDARMYSISMALSIASTLLALEALDRKRWAFWLAYVAVSWLGLHTHYFFAFVLLAQNAFVLSSALLIPSRRADAGRWLLSQVLLGLLYLPWLMVAGNTLISYYGAGDSPGLPAMLLRSLSAFAVGETVPAGQRILYVLLAGTLLLIAGKRLAQAGSSGRRTLWLLTLYLAVPLVATWISALRRPIFNERYLIAATPPFYLLLAVGVTGWGESSERRASSAGRLGASAVLLVALIAAALVSLGRYYGDPDYSKTRGWRELAAALTRLSAGLPTERVRLAQNFPDPTLWYYYSGPVTHLVLPPAAHDEAGAVREVAKLASSGVERVILPLAPVEWWDDEGIAEAALSEYYTPIATIQVGGWPVEVYVRPPASLAPVGIRFANGGTLVEATIQSQQLVPGDILPVYVRWDGLDSTLTGTEKITLQLLDSSGVLVAQTDRPFGAPESQAPVTRYDILVPRELPSGTYRVILALYDPAQPGSPRFLTQDGADHVDLGALRTP